MGRCLNEGKVPRWQECAFMKGRYKGDKKVPLLYMRGREGDSVMGRCLYEENGRCQCYGRVSCLYNEGNGRYQEDKKVPE